MGNRKSVAIKILVVLLVLSLVVSVVGFVTSGMFNTPINAETTEVIKSDGKDYSTKKVDAVKLPEAAASQNNLPNVESTEMLLKLLKERGALYDETAMRKNWSLGGDMFNSITMTDSAAAPSMDMGFGAVAESSGNAGMGGGDSYSQTNEQVEGVSEGDIVKTDGKYIYTLTENKLHIVKVEGSAMRVISTIELENFYGNEFYLVGDRLVIIGTQWSGWAYPMVQGVMPEVDSSGNVTHPEVNSIAPDYRWGGWYQNSRLVALVYDITDRAEPKCVREVSMDGYEVSTRVVGNIVYLVTNKYINAPYTRADSPSIMPYFSDAVGIAVDTEMQPFDFNCIYYIPNTNDHSYLMVGAFDITKDEPFTPNAYLGAGSTMYMGTENIFIAQQKWNTQTYGMDIYRFDVHGTELFYIGKGQVDGSIINQYSMDAHKGYFRIATNVRGVGTFISILDIDTMDVVGQTEPVEPREDMKSSRFMGDMAYFVTFENTDPLFTVDLSDPRDPKVLGELKIPGFSEYLHPVGEGLLLGIGRDTVELFSRDSTGKETVVGFRDDGVKVSLFDVSDPYNPLEVNALKLGDGWAEVSYNPRALMVDNQRSQFGFTFDRWGYNNSGTTAVVLGVTEVGVEVRKSMPITGNEWGGTRLTFIGNTLYVSHGSGLIAYDYSTYKELGRINY